MPSTAETHRWFFFGLWWRQVVRRNKGIITPCFGITTLPNPTLRWGWVFLERTRILSGIQFTMYFIDFFVVQTKRFVGSSLTAILTRQTCGQRSSRAAESKRRAVWNYFSERICYMFQISKCRGDWDLSPCTTWVIAFDLFFRKYHTLHFTCQKRSAAQWRLPKKNVFRPQKKSEFGIALQISKRKYRSCAQTYISVSSTFWR